MSDNFESVDQIKTHYALKAAQAPEEQKLQVELEEARAVASFHESQAQKVLRSTWEQEALREFPHATKDDLRGNSIDEIKAAAKARHDAVQAKIDEAIAAKQAEIEQQVGRRAYAGSGGGGGAPLADEQSDEAIMGRSRDAFENRTVGGRPTGNYKEAVRNVQSAALRKTLGTILQNNQ